MPGTLHVYSNITIDLVRGVQRPGGPGYYVAKAIRCLNLPLNPIVFSCLPKASNILPVTSDLAFTIEGCSNGSEPTIFSIEVKGARRSLNLVKYCGACDRLSSADIAIVSPVYWEIPSHVLARIPPNYKLTILDVQGYVRLGTRPVQNTCMLLKSYLDLLLAWKESGRTLVKASIEDLGSACAYEMLRRGLIDVITLGQKGLIARTSGGEVYYVEQKRISSNSIGAGDILSAVLAFSLYKGYGLLESSLIAVASSYHVLEEECMEFNKVVLDALQGKTVSWQYMDESTLLYLLYSSI